MLTKVFIGSATQEFVKELNTFTEVKDKDVRKVDYQFTDGKVIATVYYMPAEWISLTKEELPTIDRAEGGAPIQ